jgi:peptide/nickel transport system permease protein
MRVICGYLRPLTGQPPGVRSRATLIGVTVIIESIFALPAIGQALVEAINNRDILVVQGIVLVLAVVVVLANLITDLLYAVLDPRIRYGRTTA